MTVVERVVLEFCLIVVAAILVYEFARMWRGRGR